MPGAIDPAKVRKTPAEWAEEEGMVITRPLGWQGPGQPSFDTPLVYSEYHTRAMKSVLGPLAGQQVELAIQRKEEQ